MAETKTTISELSAATTVAASDLLFVSQQSGSAWNSKKATVSQLSSAIGLGNYLPLTGGSMGQAIYFDAQIGQIRADELRANLTMWLDDGLVFGFDSSTGGVLQIQPSRMLTSTDDLLLKIPVANGTLALTSDIPAVPVKQVKLNGTALTPDTSGAVNVNALTSHQSLTAYYTKADLTGTSGVLKGYSLSSHTHSQYLTAVPSTYKTYTDTKTQLGTDGFKIYAATLSSLSSTYSLTSHTHSQYSLTSHNHSGVYANTTHAHGNIQSGGTLQTTDIAIANGDKLVVTDADGSNKVARTSLSFDGQDTTQFLSKKGTWETPSITGYVSKAELNTALASVGQIPSGDGANLENTIAKFNALFAALSALTV